MWLCIQWSPSLVPRLTPQLFITAIKAGRVEPGNEASGAPLLWSPWGLGEVSCIQKCWVNVCVYLGHIKVSYQRVSLKRGSTICPTVAGN